MRRLSRRCSARCARRHSLDKGRSTLVRPCGAHNGRLPWWARAWRRGDRSASGKSAHDGRDALCEDLGFSRRSHEVVVLGGSARGGVAPAQLVVGAVGVPRRVLHDHVGGGRAGALGLQQRDRLVRRAVLLPDCGPGARGAHMAVGGGPRHRFEVTHPRGIYSLKQPCHAFRC